MDVIISILFNTGDDNCKDVSVPDTMYMLFGAVAHVLIITFVSQALHSFLKPLGQPLAVAQLLVSTIVRVLVSALLGCKLYDKVHIGMFLFM